MYLFGIQPMNESRSPQWTTVGIYDDPGAMRNATVALGVDLVQRDTWRHMCTHGQRMCFSQAQT